MKKVDMKCCGNCARSSYREIDHAYDTHLECNFDMLGVDCHDVCEMWAFDMLAGDGEKRLNSRGKE